MEKKIILLNISKSSAEIDWILPVLYELSKKYRIFTIFQNLKSYETLTKDKILFQLWKKISPEYAIDNNYDKLIRYLSNKLFSKFNLINYFKKKKLIFNDIKIILSEFGTYCWIFNEIKKISKKPTTFYFPTSSFIFGKEKNEFKVKFNLNSDYLLLCNKLDIFFWKKRIDKKKIKIVGVPKYDSNWLKKIDKTKNKKSKKSKKIILFAYSSRFNSKNNDNKKLEEQFNSILNILKNFNKCKIIFKIHPRKNDPYFMNILKNFKNIDWEISNKNLLYLTNNCDVFLHDKYSSVIYEGLIRKKPTIEYWDINKKTNTSFGHDYLKLNVIAKNPNKLKKLIKLGITNPKNKIWANQQKRYFSILKKFNVSSSKYTSDLISKISNQN